MMNEPSNTAYQFAWHMQENKPGFEVLDWQDMVWLQYQLHHYSDHTESVILSLPHILLVF